LGYVLGDFFPNSPGANTPNSEFTTTTTVLWKARAFFKRRKTLFLKTRYAISCVVNFYNAGVVKKRQE
jgi:hypothetical protein